MRHEARGQPAHDERREVGETHAPRPSAEPRAYGRNLGRRALSHVGGAVETEGSPREATLLAEALDVPSAPEPRRSEVNERREDDPDRVHVHGFHAFSARMHPVTAARLVASFTRPGQTVLDPFCGSGTVLVEAVLAGRSSVGVDLNPLAVELARAKTRPRNDDELDRVRDAAREVAASADERRRGRAGATRRYPPEDVALFEPHVLLELDSLKAAIEKMTDPAARRDLALCFSAILGKVSRKQGDTAADDRLGARRIAAGYTAKLFTRKADELAARLARFTRGVPAPPPRADVVEDDATSLASLPRLRADAIVTSPPYAATYDYAQHHALRLRWLGLDARAFQRDELGARRRYASFDGAQAHEAWRNELTRLLSTLARATRTGAPVVLMMADSAVRNVPLRADEIVADVARTSQLFAAVARASQTRPHFHAPTARAFIDAPRKEHALLLVRR